MEKRLGIHPVWNFWTYRRIARVARTCLPASQVTGKDGWQVEVALGDKNRPYYWSRELTEKQTKLLHRLDGARERTSERPSSLWNKPAPPGTSRIIERDVYMVAQYPFHGDSGIRIALEMEDAHVVSSSETSILGVDFNSGQVYSPPHDHSYSWIGAHFAAVYATYDKDGWRPWNGDDERIAVERIQQARKNFA